MPTALETLGKVAQALFPQPPTCHSCQANSGKPKSKQTAFPGKLLYRAAPKAQYGTSWSGLMYSPETVLQSISWSCGRKRRMAITMATMHELTDPTRC